MQFIDTHTHLYAEEFAEDIDTVISKAIENKVSHMILPDIDSMSRPAMLKLHERYPENCPLMIGLHPTSVKQDYKSELEKIDEIINDVNFIKVWVFFQQWQVLVFCEKMNFSIRELLLQTSHNRRG